jgi:signal transduction histidine kinase
LCELSDKNIGEKVRATLKPYSAKCLSCAFIETGAPIIVAGKHIANWIIGQGLNRGIHEKYLIETSLKYGIEETIFLEAYKNTHFVKLDHFNKIINFLWILARDISSLGYNNIILARDVEERKKTEEELIRSKNKAEESDRLKTAFLANISHEIRTPMNGILGLANLLNEEDISADQRSEYIEIINLNATLLLKLFDDIIDIAKLEANQLTFDEKPCYLDQLLQDLLIQFRFQVDQQKSKDLELILKFPENKIDTLIYADSLRLKQIINNLLTNALKFTQTGFIEFGYSTELPFYLKFYVKDTGIGLTPEKRLIIFDRFRQADESPSKKYGGTGLGLAISKNLVKLMKGEIWVESESGKGTTFYFTLPYKPYNDYEITQQSDNKRIELNLE